MANNLTGDFDVVAEFALPAVNRVLAAMHQCERLLHSIAVRVDDRPLPGPKVPYPTAVGVVDEFGDAIANHAQLGGTPVLPGTNPASDALLARLGAIFNPGELLATEGTITPSNLQGVAQLQLSTPTVSVPPQSDSITVTTNVMARYFPDKSTAALAEFMRGDVQITAPMNKVASGRVHVLNIDFKARDAAISFTPSYTSKPLSAEDLAAISLCLQNGLQTSFLPSSVTLPSSVADVQLKTLPGAVAVLLNLNSHPAAVASVTNVFVGGDDFAFAAGRDYVFNTLRPIVAGVLSQPPQHITITFGYHFSFAVTLNSASFDLQPGRIVLSIQAHAQPTNHTWVGGADFTVAVEFSLQPSGNTVQLGVGNVSVSFNTSLTGAFADLADYFTGSVSANVKANVVSALSAANAFAIVDQMFNTDTNLAQFLNAQLAPADGSSPAQPQQISLIYTSADIQQAGIVLRGLLLLKPWPDPYVEYEQVPAHTSATNITGFDEQDYSALKTWIPGGTVNQYEWSYQGQATPFQIDPNRFVLELSSVVAQPGGTMARTTGLVGYSPFCLTVRGTRIRSYGPGENAQAVSSRFCGYTRFPVVAGTALAGAAVQPMMVLTHPGPGGEVVVTGHTAAQASKAKEPAPNLVVHFADAKSASHLAALTAAVKHSKKKDAASAVIAIFQAGPLAKAPFVPGISYSEDSDGAWAKLLGLKSVKAPLTAIVTPAGNVVWQKEGVPDEKSLAAALDQHLLPGGVVRITLPRLNVRIGQPAPNFLLEFATGREMPLAKLRGLVVTLVFWKSACPASIDAVRSLQAAGQAPGSALLAVNDGERAETARAVAAECGFSEALVTDPQRKISLAYGVDLWPTVISLAESGVITAIRFGFASGNGEQAPTPSGPVKR